MMLLMHVAVDHCTSSSDIELQPHTQPSLGQLFPPASEKKAGTAGYKADITVSRDS